VIVPGLPIVRSGAAALAAILAAALSLGAAPSAGRCDTSGMMLSQDEPAAPKVPTPASPSEATPKLDPATPKNLVPLPPNEETPILGKKVKGPNGEDLGLIVDVVVDAEGQPRAAVIDFGGFLGVGSRKVAVDWRALSFSPGSQGGDVELSLGRTDIQAAPEYKPGAPNVAMITTSPASPPSPDVGR
jgi:hypothetical protein